MIYVLPLLTLEHHQIQYIVTTIIFIFTSIVFIITIVIKLSTFPAVVSMCANVVRPGLGTLPATTRSRKAEESGPLSSNLAEIHINKLLMVAEGMVGG